MNRSKENTWRQLKGEERLKPMEEIVAAIQKYVNTYDDRPGYKNYSDDMFINDMLYGIGIALDAKYQFAIGFAAFKNQLLKHIEE